LSAQSNQAGVGFAMVGVSTGEISRINALNLGQGTLPAPSRCAVTLRFLDTEGHVIKQSIVTLEPGKAASLDLSRDELPGDSRAEVRAELLFGYSGGANPPALVLQQFDCNIVPSLEVFDAQTQKTSVILTDAKPLPLPATPAQ
jgi:hypothetical protein